MQHNDPTLATIIDLETRRRVLWDAYDDSNEYGDVSRLDMAKRLADQLNRAWIVRRAAIAERNAEQVA